ncbi:MAG: segregation/condensation protein A [Chloroflexi bacterium]|nr:segregation/condensation protein A [Chloroflexota bacterium]
MLTHIEFVGKLHVNVVDTARNSKYQVQLPAFAGPLDLLLHLIQKRELEITAISLAEVTDQFLAYLSTVEQRDPGQISEFVAVATLLLVIKSRSILPKPVTQPGEVEEELDPAEALAQQLREYQKFKAAAQSLKEREDQGLRAYARLVPLDILVAAPPGQGNVADLLRAVRKALQTKPPVEPEMAPLRPHVVSIHTRIDDIEQELHLRSRLPFEELLARAPTRVDVIVWFMAVLELIKRRSVIVEQTDLFGPIWLVRVEKPAGGGGITSEIHKTDAEA